MAAKKKRRHFTPEYEAEVDEGKGQAGALTTAEREEFAAFKREVKTLRLERGILRKATAFVCHERDR